jgi:S-DNA-T family DNA segregation ATPase FtsK/SpoIIIE
VEAIIDGAREAAVPAPRRPWLEELSSAYDLALLGPRTDTELILGVDDLPELQAQQTVVFKPDSDGNLAVYGTSGTGKSVLLRTLAIGAGITPRGGPVHVYALDFAAGGLRQLEPLPHVGAVVAGDYHERVVRAQTSTTGGSPTDPTSHESCSSWTISRPSATRTRSSVRERSGTRCFSS